MMGIVRINLPLDAKFINNNFNLLKKNKKNNFFFKLFPNDKNVKKEISLTKNFYNNDKKGKDSSALDALNLLKYHKTFFFESN